MLVIFSALIFATGQSLLSCLVRNGLYRNEFLQNRRFFVLLPLICMYRFQQPVSECFCAAVVEKQLRNNGLPVPPRGDDKYIPICGTMPFIAVPAGAGNENAVWVYPDQVCTVEYMPNTKNSLRQAVFKGFRTDMVTEDID